jgi:serine protease AprX
MTTGFDGRPPRRSWAAVLSVAGVAAAVAVTVFGVAAGAAAAPAAKGGPAGHGGVSWRYDASATPMAAVTRTIGADQLWAAGSTGRGVGVALVDTGVVPVGDFAADRLVYGPDLSLDSQSPAGRYLDTYGHGTHLAGIIAGSGGQFRGVAPQARLTSVKVGAYDGAVDVSQVIAAVDWVVAHRDDDAKHPIRVLNLSYGTDSVQDYRLDPLTHAVENAWRAGIVVVVAAGNGGTAAPRLADPAADPYVIAVGATDTMGTAAGHDDTVADFSSRGTAARRVDLVAPGRSIVSLRDPGSFVDTAYPDARVGDGYFKGSGTSQAAAVVSGAVALLLQRHPDLTPDEVKAALVRSADRLPRADAAGQGAGELDVAGAAALANQDRLAGAAQGWPTSTGRGSLEAARGDAHVGIGDALLAGENDLFGPFDTAAWAAASSAGSAWVGGSWMGRQLAGGGWTQGTSGQAGWSGLTWSGLTWSGLTWSGLTWSGLTWSGLTWSGLTWSGLTWSGLTWSGLTWSGLTWSGLTWSDSSWSG